MDRIWLALILLSPFVIGLTKLLRLGMRLTDQETFAEEFGKTRHRYIESAGADGGAYGWLIHRSSKIQVQMGSTGIMAIYRPPSQVMSSETFRLS